jgi:hypothetical protein
MTWTVNAAMQNQKSQFETCESPPWNTVMNTQAQRKKTKNHITERKAQSEVFSRTGSFLRIHPLGMMINFIILPTLGLT